MYKCVNGVTFEMTEAEEEEFMASFPPPPEDLPESTPTPEDQSMLFIRSMAATATNIPDKVALSIPDLLSHWEELLSAGEPIQPGVCLVHEGQVYRMVQSTEVTPQVHQPPGGDGMLAVYRPIDREHAGTLADPIPWVYGMDCLEGKYYSYNGKIYRVAEGGTMAPCNWPPDTSGLWQWEEVT